MQRLRHRSASQRALWVLLLLLAVVLKPALSLASEAHESNHAVQTGHTHDAVEDAHQIPSDEGADDGTVDPWHSLMHLGQCCSHPSAVPGNALVVGPALAVAAPVGALFHRRANAGEQVPLRPPIRA